MRAFLVNPDPSYVSGGKKELIQIAKIIYGMSNKRK